MNILKLYLQEALTADQKKQYEDMLSKIADSEKKEKAGQAKTAKGFKDVKDKVDPLARKIAKSYVKKLHVTNAVITVIAIGTIVYKAKIQKLGLHCKVIKNSEKKKKCFINARIKSQQFQLKILANKAVKYCKRTDNPEECLTKIKNEIQKINNDIKYNKKQLEQV